MHGTLMLFHEHYFLVRVVTNEVSLRGLDAPERDVYRDHRWWSLAELKATEETFFPEVLIEIVQRAGVIASRRIS